MTSYSDSQVLGTSRVGGLIGYNYKSEISDSYSTGTLEGQQNAGGFIGDNSYASTISHCYSSTIVNADTAKGGFIGIENNPEFNSYTSCFWNKTLNPSLSDISTGDEAGIDDKSTSQMLTESSFTDYGWDFVNETSNGTEDIWTIKEDVNYPEHVWPLVQYVDWDGVDFLDYGFFANHDCNDINDCNSTDLDFSGAVDINDVNIFTSYWLFGKQ
jgi:hypothetical protein